MNNFAQLGSTCIETGARVRATALIRGEAVVQLPRCDFLRMVLRHLMAYRSGNEASDWIFFCCASYACQDCSTRYAWMSSASSADTTSLNRAIPRSNNAPSRTMALNLFADPIT